MARVPRARVFDAAYAIDVHVKNRKHKNRFDFGCQGAVEAIEKGKNWNDGTGSVPSNVPRVVKRKPKGSGRCINIQEKGLFLQ